MGIKAILKTIDTDGSGSISVEECKEFLNKPLVEAKEGLELMIKLASNEEGKLAIEDFVK